MRRSTTLALVTSLLALVAPGCSAEATPIVAADAGTSPGDGDAAPAARPDAGDPPLPELDAGADSGAVDDDGGVRPDAGSPDAGTDAGTDACTPMILFPDCDGDGFAPAGPGTSFCAAPSGPPCSSGASGAWITRAPTGLADTDCNDLRPDVNPSITAFSETPIPGAPASVDFDYTCDTVEEPERTAVGICELQADGCRFVEGWQLVPGSGLPGCGATGPFMVGCRLLMGRCVVVTNDRVQRCR